MRVTIKEMMNKYLAVCEIEKNSGDGEGLKSFCKATDDEEAGGKGAVRRPSDKTRCDGSYISALSSTCLPPLWQLSACACHYASVND